MNLTLKNPRGHNFIKRDYEKRLEKYIIEPYYTCSQCGLIVFSRKDKKLRISTCNYLQVNDVENMSCNEFMIYKVL
jgi:hypothetical protein